MTKTERDALTSLVKQRFRLLRQDIEVRKAEMIVDLDRRLDGQFAAAAKAWDDAMYQIQLARDECNRQVNDHLRGYCAQVGADYPDKSDYSMVEVRGYLNPIPGQRQTARRTAMADIDAVEAKARYELARVENQLLTDLLTDALESSDAKVFMARIPAVSTLMVPTARLAELIGPDLPEGS